MKITTAEFVTSATDLASCPQSTLPEFALIGRSNVGKSSLLNLLTGRRDLARVSATPGKTDLLNFFLINRTWLLVDLPGYGYARASRSKREGFAQSVDDYLEGREELTCVFVLIDSRLPPQAIDLQFLAWLHQLSLPFALVFTKADKQSPTQTNKGVKRFLDEIENQIGARPEKFITSTKTQAGRNELLGAITGMCADAR